MSYPNNFDGALLTIRVSDGATTPAYAHPCAINTSRSVEQSANITETVVPQCNSTSPGKVVRRVTSTSLSLAGSGIADGATYNTYAVWAKAGTSKSCKIYVGATTGWTVYTGDFLIQTLGAASEGQGSDATFQIALVSDGEYTVATQS